MMRPRAGRAAVEPAAGTAGTPASSSGGARWTSSRPCPPGRARSGCEAQHSPEQPRAAKQLTARHAAATHLDGREAVAREVLVTRPMARPPHRPTATQKNMCLRGGGRRAGGGARRAGSRGRGRGRRRLQQPTRRLGNGIGSSSPVRRAGWAAAAAAAGAAAAAAAAAGSSSSKPALHLVLSPVLHHAVGLLGEDAGELGGQRAHGDDVDDLRGRMQGRRGRDMAGSRQARVQASACGRSCCQAGRCRGRTAGRRRHKPAAAGRQRQPDEHPHRAAGSPGSWPGWTR